jgi:hypothetical protein
VNSIEIVHSTYVASKSRGIEFAWETCGVRIHHGGRIGREFDLPRSFFAGRESAPQRLTVPLHRKLSFGHPPLLEGIGEDIGISKSKLLTPEGTCIPSKTGEILREEKEGTGGLQERSMRVPRVIVFCRGKQRKHD